MTEEERQEIALFKYRIISPLLSEPERYRSNNEFFREAAGKSYVDSKGKSHTYSMGTIDNWYYKYKKYGFEALKPKGRSDAGQSRVIDEDIAESIKQLKSEYPRLPSTTIRGKLIENGTIRDKDVSLSTITRYVNGISQEKTFSANKDMRRYEREHINEVWCGDTSYGPYIKIGKEKQRTFIMGLMDDASRMIISMRVVTRDNYINLMGVMKEGVEKYGVPNMFNFDNGKNYRSHQINLMVARIGSVIHYNPAYTPTGKAKIERWFRTMKDHWMASLTKDDLSSIENLNESLQKYINEYNHTVHSSLKGKTPQERYFEEQKRIRRLPSELIHNAFLLEIERKVSADNVVVIDNIEYEVSYVYSRKRIKLRYSEDLSEVYVVEGDDLVPIKLLNKVENSTMKREKVKLYEGE